MFAIVNVQTRFIQSEFYIFGKALSYKNITDTSIYYTIYVIKPFIIKKQNPDMAWL